MTWQAAALISGVGATAVAWVVFPVGSMHAWILAMALVPLFAWLIWRAAE